MVTNSWWIKADYWVQTVLGSCLLLALISIVGWFFALILLGVLGLWQVISGLLGAISGDRLQQIYVVVVGILLCCWIFNRQPHTEISIYVVMICSCVIAVWKYTVVRADYVSLKIIAVPEVVTKDVLDA